LFGIPPLKEQDDYYIGGHCPLGTPMLSSVTFTHEASPPVTLPLPMLPEIS